MPLRDTFADWEFWRVEVEIRGLKSTLLDAPQTLKELRAMRKALRAKEAKSVSPSRSSSLAPESSLDQECEEVARRREVRRTWIPKEAGRAPPPRRRSSDFADKLDQDREQTGRWTRENMRLQRLAALAEETILRNRMVQRRKRIEAALPSGDAKRYSYAQLDDPAAQVRLLEYDVIDGNIICVQSVHNLDTAPAFVAVSYAWGSAKDSKTIWIDGMEHNVRQNCWLALKKLGHLKDRDRAYVWIDAVCINQSDAKEKSHQVQMMTSIFGSAAFVAAIPNDASSALGHLDSATYPPVGDSMFGRIWIVQELLVAREVRLIEYAHIRPLEDLLQPFSGDNQARPLLRVLRDRDHRRAVSDPLALLFHYLSKYSDFSCTDQRDRIYALVPMSLRYSGVPSLKPDYEKSLLGALLDFVHYVCLLSAKQEHSAPGRFSDLMICLMKLIDLFGLSPGDNEVDQFLSNRVLRGLDLPTAPAPSPKGKEPAGEYFSFENFEATCLNRDQCQTVPFDLCTVADLGSPAQMNIADMGFDITDAGVLGMTAICSNSDPVFIGTKELTATDVLLTPTIGPLAWTWNLAFRAAPDRPNTFQLVGQAIPVKQARIMRLRKRSGCNCEDCPALKSHKRIMLHPRDVLALALLSRNPAQRLKRAVTTKECASFAAFS